MHIRDSAPLTTESQSECWVPERHPGASTISSQLLDGDCSHGWQILAPGAHDLKQTILSLCNSIFKDQFIFRLHFYTKKKQTNKGSNRFGDVMMSS